MPTLLLVTIFKKGKKKDKRRTEGTEGDEAAPSEVNSQQGTAAGPACSYEWVIMVLSVMGSHTSGQQ